MSTSAPQPSPTPRAPTRRQWFIAAALSAFVLWAFFNTAATDPTARQVSADTYDREALQRLVTLQLPEVRSGTSRTLADWSGKVRVINFWASWCPPCERELPDFAAVARAYADRDVQFIGIGLDEREKLLAMIERFDLPYPTLIGAGFALGQTVRLGNPTRGMPFTLVLDARGEPVAQHVGLMTREQLEAAIAKALAAHVPR